MLAWLRAAWERLSALGIGDEAAGARRRIRLTNQAALVAAASCATFGTGYAIAGARTYWPPLVANIIAVALSVTALALNARGHRFLARYFVLVPAHVAVIAASTVLGGRVGLLCYFFVFASVAFMLFASDDKGPRFACFSLSAVSCVGVRLFAPSSAEIAARLSEGEAAAFDIVSAVGVLGTVAVMVHLFTSDTEQAEERAAKEHERSERLLLNILPSSISTRLKSDGESIADGFAEVSVLFADIVGFTEISQKLSPDSLVRMLNRIFSAFDDLAERLGLEKIKTIGDAYMVACGLPVARTDHAHATAMMALEMRRALSKISQEEGLDLAVRIGMHAGPVVAGVIGKRKFIYDLWGDTVNTASRMESSGLPGEIQVTAEMRDRLMNDFDLVYRGTVAVKGKGNMETYLLRGETLKVGG